MTIKVPFNRTYQAQQKKLIRATFKKGIISAIHKNTFSVDVNFIGNQQTVVRNVPLANTIDINTLAIGNRCKVDLFDETNPMDMCVAYTY